MIMNSRPFDSHPCREHELTRYTAANHPLVRRILDFWFLPRRHPGHGKSRDLWFAPSSALDGEIADKFGRDILRALSGRYDHLADAPEGALALLVLLDQFTRNAFRRTARAYCGDTRARRIAGRAIARGFDRRFPGAVRTFFYLPFEHSEHLADQNRAVGLFSQVLPPSPPRWAVQHRELIRRFGRFPHRNAALDRIDTPAERVLLAGAHERFGQ